MNRADYKPDQHIPDLSGRVILVTGGNSGLGRESILTLAKHNPSRIYLAARDASKASRAVDLIKAQVPDAAITVLQCDLGSLKSVQMAAKQVASETVRLDILMCNAGVVTCPMGLSEEGYEIQFATNHLGHALLIKLLLPLLRKTAECHGDARIISLASTAFAITPKGGIQFDTLESTQDSGFSGPPKRYGQSKLANILYANELARRFPQLTCLSVHPGAVKTELFTSNSLPMRMFICIMTWLQGEMMWPVEQGAYSQLWAATIPKDQISHNGGLYKPVGKYLEPTGYLKDTKLQEELWDWTETKLEDYTL